jgi:hypothetical protein
MAIVFQARTAFGPAGAALTMTAGRIMVTARATIINIPITNFTDKLFMFDSFPRHDCMLAFF